MVPMKKNSGITDVAANGSDENNSGITLTPITEYNSQLDNDFTGYSEDYSSSPQYNYGYSQGYNSTPQYNYEYPEDYNSPQQCNYGYPENYNSSPQYNYEYSQNYNSAPQYNRINEIEEYVTQMHQNPSPANKDRNELRQEEDKKRSRNKLEDTEDLNPPQKKQRITLDFPDSIEDEIALIFSRLSDHNSMF